jgi:cell division protease FtsH
MTVGWLDLSSSAVRLSDMSETASTPPQRPAGTPTPGGHRSAWGWLLPVLVFGGFALWDVVLSRQARPPNVSYTDFYQRAAEDKIASLTLRGQEVRGKFKHTETVAGRTLDSFTTMLPAQEDKDLLPLLRQHGVEIMVESEERPLAVTLMVTFLPWIVIGGLWIWLSRRAQSAMAGGIRGLIGGRQRRFEKQAQVGVRFDDVAGLKGAKRDLQEIVDFLRSPDEFKRLGGKVPRGVLLVGPPGTGKTLLARAVAGEAGVPFFSINGSEFIELFVGVGAARVRELFEQARKVAPSIIFIDEIDAVGRSRGAGLGGGNDEREQTLNQMLSEMDGFTRTDLVIVIAATNRPDVLDPALLRPGRFDRHVTVDRPELEARNAILKVHTREIPLAPDVNLRAIAAETAGFAGADLANLANEAALHATRRHANAVEAQDFRAAYDKVVLGELRETTLSPAERRRVTVHESGHTAVAHFTPGAEPPERVTIIPRGMALGVTQQVPGGDRYTITQSELEARLRVLMGGYAAESVVFGDLSSGAQDDLRKATNLAFEMVAHYGMSERIGPIFYEHRTEHPFLGRTVAVEGATSDATVYLIEEETRRILTEALGEARRCIESNRAPFDALAAALLERETLEKADITQILGPAIAPAPSARAAG